MDLDQEVDLLCDSQTPIPSSHDPLICPVFLVAGGPVAQPHNNCFVTSCQVKSNCPVIGQGAKCLWAHCPLVNTPAACSDHSGQENVWKDSGRGLQSQEMYLVALGLYPAARSFHLSSGWSD